MWIQTNMASPVTLRFKSGGVSIQEKGAPAVAALVMRFLQKKLRRRACLYRSLEIEDAVFSTISVHSGWAA